jgi:hypothetical protein
LKKPVFSGQVTDKSLQVNKTRPYLELKSDNRHSC